jgi:hypothetical protein
VRKPAACSIRKEANATARASGARPSQANANENANVQAPAEKKALGQLIYGQKAIKFAMCSTCGCGIDLGGIEEVFAKNYRCGDCNFVFKGFGYKLSCPRCKSANTAMVK